jgi:hypothetical protein
MAIPQFRALQQLSGVSRMAVAHPLARTLPFRPDSPRQDGCPRARCPATPLAGPDLAVAERASKPGAQEQRNKCTGRRFSWRFYFCPAVMTMSTVASYLTRTEASLSSQWPARSRLPRRGTSSRPIAIARNRVERPFSETSRRSIKAYSRSAANLSHESPRTSPASEAELHPMKIFASPRASGAL